MSIVVEIEKIRGGYILCRGSERELIPSTDALFGVLLQIFEGRAGCFSGDFYGRVEITRTEPE
jgi:hypothetical protein